MTTSHRRTLGAGIAAAAVAALVTSTPALAAEGKKPAAKKPSLQTVQLLSFNDYHGHLEATDPPLSRSTTRRRRRSAVPSTSRRSSPSSVTRWATAVA